MTIVALWLPILVSAVVSIDALIYGLMTGGAFGWLAS